MKLYDKASAVVAELVANSYDADAEKVTVRVPYNTLLAKKVKKAGAFGKGAEHVEDLGCVIEVEDDGHGMTPDEAIDFYLRSAASSGAKASRKRSAPCAPFRRCTRRGCRSATTATAKQMPCVTRDVWGAIE